MGVQWLVLRGNTLALALRRRPDIPIAWLVFVAVAYVVPYVAPKRSLTLTSLTLFWSFFTLTVIILCDQITMSIQEFSLLHETTHSARAWLSLLSVGAVGGLLLDGIAQWLAKLWIYPYWNEAVYASTFVIGFCSYWLATVESYLAVKVILDCWHSQPSAKRSPRRHEVALFRMLGAMGCVLIVCGVAWVLESYRNTGYVFDTRRAFPLKPPFRGALMAFIGVWFALEWVQFAQGKLSLVKAALSGRLHPVCALLIASGCFGLFQSDCFVQLCLRR